MIDQNPYAVTATQPSRGNAVFAAPPQTERAKYCYWLVCIAIPLLLVATVLAWWEIETIMGSGTVMAIYGAVLLFLTTRRGLPRFRWLAWICVVYPICIFMLIFLMEWAPHDAHLPVSLIVTATTCVLLMSLSYSLVALQRQRTEQAVADLNDQIDSASDANFQSRPEVVSTPDRDNPFVARDDSW